MNFVSLVQVLLAAVLHLAAVKTASLNKGTEESRRDVVSFREVITKSMCQPREVLVDIFQEYPEDTEHTYIPSSVVLNLCGGCCSDEAMECAPTQTRNTTLQVMRFRHMLMQHTIHLSFTEHERCDCRCNKPRTSYTVVKEFLPWHSTLKLGSAFLPDDARWEDLDTDFADCFPSEDIDYTMVYQQSQCCYKFAITIWMQDEMFCFFKLHWMLVCCGI